MRYRFQPENPGDRIRVAGGWAHAGDIVELTHEQAASPALRTRLHPLPVTPAVQQPHRPAAPAPGAPQSAGAGAAPSHCPRCGWQFDEDAAPEGADAPAPPLIVETVADADREVETPPPAPPAAPEGVGVADEPHEPTPPTPEQCLVDYLRGRGEATRADVAAELGVEASRLPYVLRAARRLAAEQHNATIEREGDVLRWTV
ncbi:MAG: hypothetical protein Q8Q14_00545 [Gemmatimonadales bacterium]|nr:hypothetical protein [Gemmatimonadales bacterium]